MKTLAQPQYAGRCGAQLFTCEIAELIRRIAAAVFLVVVIAVSCAAQSDQQSLGQVAREHKGNTRKAARVVTNDEIPSVSVIETSSGSAVSSANGNGAADPSSTASPDKSAEKPSSNPPRNLKGGVNVPGLLSHGTLDEAKALLDSLKHDRQALIDNYDKIEQKMANTDSDSLRRVYSESLARREETLAQNQKSIDDTQKAIEQVQDQNGQGANQ
jgi:hypothetical protein